MEIKDFVSTTGRDLFCDDIVRVALDIGEGILKNGGEVSRVEDAVDRICRAYGAVHTEVFCIHSVIIAAARMHDGAYSSQLRRVRSVSNRLYVLEDYNALSRKLCTGQCSIEEADKLIRTVKDQKPYPFWLVFLGGLLAAGAFAIFFGGSWRDGIAAALIGLLVTAVDSIRFPHLNSMAKTLLLSFLAGALSSLSVRIGIGENTDMITIGTIMLLIPGLALGNALRDLVGGDTLAGTLRVVQSCLSAVMIALGYTLAFLLLGHTV